MNSIEKLKEIFTKFPTVGPRTAERFIYYLMKLPKEKIDELILAIQELKNNIKLCQFCFNPYEEDKCPTSNQLCLICSDPRRDRTLLCIVEKETDLLSIEKTKKYSGLYFILGITNLRINELKARVAKNKFSEIIIALNPTPEGITTSVLIEKEMKNLPSQAGSEQTFKITHLARGIPVGGELEYADEETLESALSGRN